MTAWSSMAAWQIKLHEKSACSFLLLSVSLFCDVRDKNVTWFFHFRDLHEFFKISLFLLTKYWSLTNSSEENLHAETAFSFYWEPKPTATGEHVKIQRWVFYLQNKKTLHVLTHLLATLSLPSLQDCAVAMNTGTGVDEFSFLVQFWHTVLINSTSGRFAYIWKIVAGYIIK